MSTASADTVHNHLGVEAVSMAHRQHISEAERLKEQWRDFRQAGAVMYDVLLWQDLKWPALSLAWLPKTVWEQPPAVAEAEAAAKQRRRQRHEQQAAEIASHSESQQPQQNQHLDSSHDMDVDEAPSAAAAAGAETSEDTGQQQLNRQQHLVQMPVEYHYLLVGGQTSGQGTATIDLYRVEVPGLVEQPLPPGQCVLMQASDMQQIMRISHGLLDVNRLAVMPQQPNIIATACDQPEVYLFDLRQHTVQEWSGQEGSNLQEESEGEQDNGQQDSHPAGNIQHSEQTPGNGSESDTVNASDSDSSGPTEPPNPQAVLTGRTAGGFALEFNPQKQALLLGGDLAGGVQLWDVAAASSSGGSSSGSSSAAQRIKPLQEVQGFAPCTINDLCWHRGGTAYALALENGQVWVQDLRAPASNGNSSASAGSSRSALGLTHFTGPGVRQPSVGAVHVSRRRERRLQQLEQEGGQRAAQDCYCVAFDPLHDYRLASGGADGYIKLLDMRRLDDPVEELSMHAGSVTSVVWSHTLPGLLASAGEDGAVLLWDANKLQHADAFACHQLQQQQQGLGLPQPLHIAREGLTNSVREFSWPGLLFMHGGHLGLVGALASSPDRPWLVASSTGQMVEAEDVVIQMQPVMVWEPNRMRGLLC